ncbi:DUF4177 domain-containing protein [Paracoccus yeei]|uniref:DUF4177 domain-containing protein n=1 Tax=Paracoccus yeei TaxID=147645 RepID=A0A1V0GTL5_9RHOB|nr:DUF4177 domain-containing protein [Paracoccus yeei]ARC37162.1 DUF4177 domain-containing protein [Paracoccus yeei]
MSSYEYIAIPAPARGEKTRGAKTGIDRFAATLTDTLNRMAGDGWDYVRAETLPAEERSGLTSRTTVYHNLLVFRRSLAAAQPMPDPVRAAPEPAPAPVPEPAPAPEPAETTPPVRAPFSQPMRAMPKQQQQARPAEPPLTAPAPTTPPGPRLGPANR